MNLRVIPLIDLISGTIMRAKIPPPVIAIACIVINYLSTLLITSFTFSNQKAIGGLVLIFGFLQLFQPFLYSERIEQQSTQ